MAARDHRRRPRTTIALMVLLSITVITVSAKDVPVLSSVRGAVLDVLAPIGRGFRSATRPVRSWFGSATDYDEVVAENRRLRDRIAELEGEVARNEGAANQLAALREQLQIPFVKETPTIVAEVSTGPFSNFDDDTLQLNRGTRDGVEVGNPVVTAAGLVGRITEVTERNSLVQLITDGDLKVGVRLAGTNNLASGHGTGAGNPFVVDQSVELVDPVEEGETVLTSGLASSRFPPEVPIGWVVAVAPSQSDQTQKLEVRIAADLERLDVVQIMRWKPATP